MARWKVTAKHYIYAEQYGQPTEWERQEINGDTGRMFRKAYKVPLYVDPEDRFCINQQEGFCVVAHKGTERPGDIIFYSMDKSGKYVPGVPTPDMEPLDDEAHALTEAERPRWTNPIDGLDPIVGADFGKQMLEILERQLDAAVNAKTQAPKSSDVQNLMDIVAKQQEQIKALMAGVKPQPDPVEAIVPLSDIEPDIALEDINPDALPAPPPIRVDRPRSAIRRH